MKKKRKPLTLAEVKAKRPNLYAYYLDMKRKTGTTWAEFREEFNL